MNIKHILLSPLIFAYSFNSYARNIEAGTALVGMDDIYSYRSTTASINIPGSSSSSTNASYVGYAMGGLSLGYFIAQNFVIGANITRVHSTSTRYDDTTGVYKALVRYYIPVMGDEKISGVLNGAYGRVSISSSGTGNASILPSETTGSSFDLGGGLAYQPIAGASIDFTLRYSNTSTQTEGFPYTVKLASTILGVALNVLF